MLKSIAVAALVAFVGMSSDDVANANVVTIQTEASTFDGNPVVGKRYLKKSSKKDSKMTPSPTGAPLVPEATPLKGSKASKASKKSKGDNDSPVAEEASDNGGKGSKASKKSKGDNGSPVAEEASDNGGKGGKSSKSSKKSKGDDELMPECGGSSGGASKSSKKGGKGGRRLPDYEIQGKGSKSSKKSKGDDELMPECAEDIVESAPEQPNPVPSPTPQPVPPPTPQPAPRPTPQPAPRPTPNPTRGTGKPTQEPTESPTEAPVVRLTREPTKEPTKEPTPSPTPEPTPNPTANPTRNPTANPTRNPTANPSSGPTDTITIQVEFPLSADDLQVCKCDTDNNCVDTPTPQGSTLRLCFLTSTFTSINKVDSLYLEQTGVFWNELIMDNVAVHRDAKLECADDMKSCVVEAPLDGQFFFGGDAPTLQAKGTITIFGGAQSVTGNETVAEVRTRQIPGRRDMAEEMQFVDTYLKIEFDETLMLEVADVEEEEEIAPRVQQQEETVPAWMWGLSLAIVLVSSLMTSSYDYAADRFQERFGDVLERPLPDE